MNNFINKELIEKSLKDFDQRLISEILNNTSELYDNPIERELATLYLIELAKCNLHLYLLDDNELHSFAEINDSQILLDLYNSRCLKYDNVIFIRFINYSRILELIDNNTSIDLITKFYKLSHDEKNYLLYKVFSKTNKYQTNKINKIIKYFSDSLLFEIENLPKSTSLLWFTCQKIAESDEIVNDIKEKNKEILLVPSKYLDLLSYMRLKYNTQKRMSIGA